MEWISVKDRLPKKSGFYLVSILGKMVDTLEFDATQNKFLSIFIGNGVTHWMPLPEPPKEN